MRMCPVTNFDPAMQVPQVWVVPIVLDPAFPNPLKVYNCFVRYRAYSIHQFRKRFV